MSNARSGSSIGCASAWYADGRGLDPHARQNILSLRFGHEKSKAILSIPLIQEEQLSVTGERSTGKLPRRLAQEQCVRLTDCAQNDLKCVEGPYYNNNIISNDLIWYTHSAKTF